MKPRWLAAPGLLLVLTALLHGRDLPDDTPNGPPVPATIPLGYLARDHQLSPYYPQPGDLYLCDEGNRFHHALYKIVGTAPPTHSAIVIAQEDGTPALLDLHGPTVCKARVVVLDLPRRLHSFPGIILVRRLRQPLSAAQCNELLHFARSQEGRGFALGRVLLQGSPFNAHHGLRRHLFGHTYEDRQRWFCSEMVVAAACAAHILDPHRYPANAIYPRDLAFDEEIDLSCLYEPAAQWTAGPAAHASSK